MDLPPFPEKRPKGQIKVKKIDKSKIEGKIEFNHKINKFTIIKGDQEFGSFDTMTEAYLAKKTLIENDWNPQSLKEFEKIKNAILHKDKKKKEIKLNVFCPNCGNKIEKDTAICPFCGIHIKEYKH